VSSHRRRWQQHEAQEPELQPFMRGISQEGILSPVFRLRDLLRNAKIQAWQKSAAQLQKEAGPTFAVRPRMN
jgi:hypothetical protein